MWEFPEPGKALAGAGGTAQSCGCACGLHVGMWGWGGPDLMDGDTGATSHRAR